MQRYGKLFTHGMSGFDQRVELNALIIRIKNTFKLRGASPQILPAISAFEIFCEDISFSICIAMVRFIAVAVMSSRMPSSCHSSSALEPMRGFFFLVMFLYFFHTRHCKIQVFFFSNSSINNYYLI